MVELVDTQDLGSCAFGCEGSSPSLGTRLLRSFPKAQAGQRQIRLSVLDVKADWRDALTGLLDRLAS